MSHSHSPSNPLNNLAARGLGPQRLLISWLAACNLSFGTLAEVFDRGDGELLLFPLAGALVAEAAIVPSWLAWGSGPLARRLAVFASLAALLTALFYVGLLPWMPRGDAMRDVPLILFSIPTIVVAASGPLWLARLFFGWRIVPREQAGSAESKLSIRDLLIGMAVVAVALGSARLALAIGQLPRESEYWPGLAIAVGVAAAAALTVELPLAWAAFRFPWLAPSALAVGGLALLAWVVLLIVITSIERHLPDGEIVVGLFLFCLSLGYTSAAAFWLARAGGERLVVRS